MQYEERLDCLYANANIKQWGPAGQQVRLAMITPRSGCNLDVFATENQARFMSQWLGGAVQINDVAAAQALLEAGILHDHRRLDRWLIDAATFNYPEMAALLCKHGATPLGQRGWWVNRIKRRCTHANPETRKLWEFVLQPPENELSEKAHYITDSSHQIIKCATSWPPFELQDETPLPVGSVVAPLVAHQAIRELWDAQCALRRAEARCLAKFNWMRARNWWRARTIALYWLGAMLERRHAPGGQGRAEDLAEYRAEFAL